LRCALYIRCALIIEKYCIFSAGQDISRFLCSQKFHYCLQKNPSPFLSRILINRVYAFQFYSFKIYFHILFPSAPRSFKQLYLLSFLREPVCFSRLPCVCHMPRPCHFPHFFMSPLPFDCLFYCRTISPEFIINGLIIWINLILDIEESFRIFGLPTDQLHSARRHPIDI
jgi:hypothetical protein